MNSKLTSLLYVCDQTFETSTMVLSSMNLAKICNDNLELYESDSTLEYEALMMALPGRSGMSEFMLKKKEILAQYGTKAEIWIPESVLRETVFDLIAGAQWRLSGYLILHDITLNLSQANIVINAVESLVSFPNRIYFNKTGFLKKELHVGVFPSNMLPLVFMELNQQTLSNESDSISTFLKVLERAAKKQPKIKIEYISI